MTMSLVIRTTVLSLWQEGIPPLRSQMIGKIHTNMGQCKLNDDIDYGRLRKDPLEA